MIEMNEINGTSNNITTPTRMPLTHSLNRIKTLQQCNSTSSTSTFTNERHFQKQQEKTTRILVAIILLFVLCHGIRLTIQVILLRSCGESEITTS